MSTGRLCSNCKAVVPREHFYCGRCGASYGEDEREQANETLFFGAMQAPGRAKLILISGEGLEGLSYHLNSTEHGAGKESGVVLFPDDDYLDDEHATFYYRSNKLYLRDEGSLNGTFIRIDEPRELSDGDEILVGRQRLRVEELFLQDKYKTADGTLKYVSPSHDYKFRLVHLVDGGDPDEPSSRAGRKPGDAFCDHSNSLTIGREGADILFADDRHISRHHARVEWKGDKIVVHDLGSKNGTYVRIDDEEPLGHGDYVAMGNELMRVEINE